MTYSRNDVFVLLVATLMDDLLLIVIPLIYWRMYAP
jgi:hypothetical protein